MRTDVKKEIQVHKPIMDVRLAGQSVIDRKSALSIELKKIKVKFVLLAVRQAANVLREHIVDVELAIGVDRCNR